MTAAPRSVPTLFNQALDLASHGETQAAIAMLEAVIEMDPTRAEAWSNLGVLHSDRNAVTTALAAHARALALRPDDAQLRVNRVVTLLRAGRLEEAWRDYEWRLRLPAKSAFPTALLMPSLAARPDIAGRTILVTHEEGFGDTLQFARYLPLLAARGADVLVAAPPQLRRILGRMDGVTLICEADVAPGGRWRQVDDVCPFVSLPRVFGTDLTTIPADPYLSPDPIDADDWAARLPAGDFRVGLVWAGQARPWLPGFDEVDRRRSTSLATLRPLAEAARVRFISLQKGAPAAEVAAWPALFDPMPQVRDFADTAAIIANLDVVVSVDTAVAHLAGAIGKPVLLLDRIDSCWRWLSGRTDSPWYPRLRIFRQQRAGDWTAVVRDIAEAIARRRDEAGAMVRS